MLQEDSVESWEPLARYVLNRSQLDFTKRDEPILRAKAFIPHPRVKTSVYRIHEWGYNEIKDVGDKVANEREENHRELLATRGETVKLVDQRYFKNYGWGKLRAKDVTGIKLKLVISDPRPRHADIEGWPTNEEKKETIAQQTRLALLLRSKTVFVKVA